jgi:poly(3-hydroxybutyrate) depolymerase
MFDEASTLTDSPAKPLAPNTYSDIAAQLYAPPAESNSQTESAGDHQVQFSLQGKNREFEYHVPPGYDGSHTIPVVYVLHGVDGSIGEIKSESGLNQIADQKGFAVVYLQSLPKETSWGFLLPDFTSWNLQHGSITKYDTSYDDLNYVKEVMSKVGQ